MKLIGKGFLIGMAVGAGRIGYNLVIAIDLVLTRKLTKKLEKATAKLHELNEEAATTGDANVDDGK
jgi:hypothetical protein